MTITLKAGSANVCNLAFGHYTSFPMNGLSSPWAVFVQFLGACCYRNKWLLNSTLKNPASQPPYALSSTDSSDPASDTIEEASSSLSGSASNGCYHHHRRLLVPRSLSPLLQSSRIGRSLMYVPIVFLLFSMYSVKVYSPTSLNNPVLSGCAHSPVWSFFFGRFLLAIRQAAR